MDQTGICLDVWLNTLINRLLKDTLHPVNCFTFAQSINDHVVCHKHLTKSLDPTFQGTGCNFHLTLAPNKPLITVL
jgi:hypothetical protein